MKMLIVDGVGYPTSAVTKVEPAFVSIHTEFGELGDDFTVGVAQHKTAHVNVYMQNGKPIDYSFDMSGQNNEIYLPTDENFLAWLDEQTMDNGKEPAKVFRAALSKVVRIRQMIKEAEMRKTENNKLVQAATPVIEQSVQTATPVAVSTVETETGVSLDVALKDLTDEPLLPFEPNITVQPEIKTDALIANEEVMQFNMPSVSDEDFLTLKKKERTVKKWLLAYIEEANGWEDEDEMLIAKRGVELPEGVDSIREHIIKCMEEVL